MDLENDNSGKENLAVNKLDIAVNKSNIAVNTVQIITLGGGGRGVLGRLSYIHGCAR